jgi:hypothetical protein
MASQTFAVTPLDMIGRNPLKLKEPWTMQREFLPDMGMKFLSSSSSSKLTGRDDNNCANEKLF